MEKEARSEGGVITVSPGERLGTAVPRPPAPAVLTHEMASGLGRPVKTGVRHRCWRLGADLPGGRSFCLECNSFKHLSSCSDIPEPRSPRLPATRRGHCAVCCCGGVPGGTLGSLSPGPTLIQTESQHRSQLRRGGRQVSSCLWGMNDGALGSGAHLWPLVRRGGLRRVTVTPKQAFVANVLCLTHLFVPSLNAGGWSLDAGRVSLPTGTRVTHFPKAAPARPLHPVLGG